MFKTTTPLQRLRETYSMKDLPDSIRTSEMGELGHSLAKPLASATVDDIAFATQAIDDEVSALFGRAAALKRLHDRARRAGALGADLAVDAALRFEERRK
ncbi:MAG: hypothetical protein K2X46_07345 [Roseomonas sp.]|nr:hypothetical protein [Roseomonas sp.]